MLKMDNLDADMNEREIAAYVQQQMVDLTPHLEEKTALQMRLTKRKEGFEAELTATSEEGEIQTIGWDKDICDAIKNAKEGLLEYFVEVEAEQNPRERDEKINHLSRNGNLYLH